MENCQRPVARPYVDNTCGAYLRGGFGIWELAYPLLATPVVYAGLRSYWFIGIAWLMHSGWDLTHHLWGNPLWPFMPTSFWGCMIFDAVIAIWFLAGAPALLQHIWPSEVRAYSPSNQSRLHGRVGEGHGLVMEAVLRARTLSETRGFMKALLHHESDEILGFTAVGPHAGEILAVVQTAMMEKLPYTLLCDAVFTHPTG